MNKSKFLVSAAIISLSLSSNVSAVTYSFEVNNPAGGDEAGDITNIRTSYDSISERFSWQSSIRESSGPLANAFWLVVSDGPDPMIDRNEYAIFYGDAQSGDVSAYVYNGVNSGSSWNTPGEFIHTYENAFSVSSLSADEVLFSFSIDASALNDYVPTTPGTNDWDGAQYDETLGIWYHPVVLADAATYDASGALETFPEIVSGYYDDYNQTTSVSVPEPGVLMLSFLGLVGTFVQHRRRKSA